MPKHVATLKVSRRPVARLHQSHRGLKLLDGLVHEIHLFVSRTHIVMRFVIFANLVGLLSDAKFFEELGKAGVNSRCHWLRSTDIVATIAYKCFIRGIVGEGYRFSYRRRSHFFSSAKLKYSGRLRLLISRCKLLTPRLNIRMRAKLPFEHLERVDRNIRVTLRDVEI